MILNSDASSYIFLELKHLFEQSLMSDIGFLSYFLGIEITFYPNGFHPS